MSASIAMVSPVVRDDAPMKVKSVKFIGESRHKFDGAVVAFVDLYDNCSKRSGC